MVETALAGYHTKEIANTRRDPKRWPTPCSKSNASAGRVETRSPRRPGLDIDVGDLVAAGIGWPASCSSSSRELAIARTPERLAGGSSLSKSSCSLHALAGGRHLPECESRLGSDRAAVSEQRLIRVVTDDTGPPYIFATPMARSRATR